MSVGVAAGIAVAIVGGLQTFFGTFMEEPDVLIAGAIALALGAAVIIGASI